MIVACPKTVALVLSGLQTTASTVVASTFVKHLEHVFDKLGVGTRTAAAAKVFEASGYRVGELPAA